MLRIECSRKRGECAESKISTPVLIQSVKSDVGQQVQWSTTSHQIHKLMVGEVWISVSVSVVVLFSRPWPLIVLPV